MQHTARTDRKTIRCRIYHRRPQACHCRPAGAGLWGLLRPWRTQVAPQRPPACLQCFRRPTQNLPFVSVTLGLSSHRSRWIVGAGSNLACPACSTRSEEYAPRTVRFGFRSLKMSATKYEATWWPSSICRVRIRSEHRGQIALAACIQRGMSLRPSWRLFGCRPLGDQVPCMCQHLCCASFCWWG